MDLNTIGIVGAGRVARILGRRLLLGGQAVVAVAARERANGRQAASFIGPGVESVGIGEIGQLACRLLIAVSDDAIPSVAARIARTLPRGLVAVHTCGARGPEALEPLREAGFACGLFHPLQTLSRPERDVHRLRGIVFGIAGDSLAVEWSRQMARLFEGFPVLLDPKRLPLYHAGAVMACNAIFAVLDAAVSLMGRAGLSAEEALSAIDPICRSTLDNALRAGPREGVTGPIVRGDAKTVRAHLEALGESPDEVAGLYREVSRYLLGLARLKGRSEGRLAALEAMLSEAGGPESSIGPPSQAREGSKSVRLGKSQL